MLRNQIQNQLMNNIRQIYSRNRDSRPVVEARINRISNYTRGVWVFMVMTAMALLLMMIDYSERPSSYDNYVATVKTQ